MLEMDDKGGFTAESAKRRPGSVMVPPGYELDYFTQNYFKGPKKTFVGEFLRKNEVNNFELACQPIEIDDKKARGSIRIRQQPTGRVTGYWKGITSSEAQIYTFSVGLRSTDS